RKSADIAQQADVAVFFAALAAAEVEDAEAAKGEVVANRIGWIECGQSIGDRSRRLPVGGLAVVQAEEGGDAMNVRVDRHDELRRIDERPASGVGGCAAPHPAEI